MRALLEQARQPTWRFWARDAAIEKKELLKAQGYSWSTGEFERPKCWHCNVSDADKAAEAAWLRANVIGPGETRIDAPDHGEGPVRRSMLGLEIGRAHV